MQIQDWALVVARCTINLTLVFPFLTLRLFYSLLRKQCRFSENRFKRFHTFYVHDPKQSIIEVAAKTLTNGRINANL